MKLRKINSAVIHFTMKKIILLLGLLFQLLPLGAAPVDVQQARQIARLWWKNKNPRHPLALLPEEMKMQTYARAYCFTAADEFLLVTTDDAAPAVLGYGRRNSSRPMPAPLQAMLSVPHKAVQYPLPGAHWTAVSPLLTTVRHQSSPYNLYCPTYKDEKGIPSAERCVVGCVATAMEQILTYHRRVYTLNDTLKGWKTDAYDISDLLPGEVFDTRLIRDNYDTEQTSAEEREAVARLSYALGVAVHMKWGLSESAASTSKMESPLKKAFGLKYVHYLDSYKYAPLAYWNYIAAEIMSHRPVYYSGSIMRTGGHAFVLDGLDADGLFHVNWGYGGDYDGYYRLDVLAHPQPEADRHDEVIETGFFCNQEAIAVYPDSLPDVVVPDTLHRTGDEVQIESVRFGAAPVSGCHTPVYLCVRNTAKQALTTPFALLQNELTDTALCDQAEWLALSGRTLEAGQCDTLLVHLQFTRPGRLLLSVSPDGRKLLRTDTVEVGEGGLNQLQTDLPQCEFIEGTTLQVRQHYTNPSNTERAAQTYIYDLTDCETLENGQIQHYIYLAPGADTTDVVSFRKLIPSHTYTLRLRQRWPVVQQIELVCPPSSGIDNTVDSESQSPVVWYTLDGRRIAAPRRAGIYLRKQGKQIQKHIVVERP